MIPASAHSCSRPTCLHARLAACGPTQPCSSLMAALCQALASAVTRPPAAPHLYPPIYYNSLASPATFALTKALLDQQGAEERCRQLGGHLAGYVSRLEQVDLERGLQEVVRGPLAGC